MNRIVLLMLLPFLMATTCVEDIETTGFESEYFLKNDAGSDLFLLDEDNVFVKIESGTTKSIGNALNPETSPISPSASYVINAIKLYTKEGDDFVLVYTQELINDNLWIFNEPTVNRYTYTLIIKDALLNR